MNQRNSTADIFGANIDDFATQASACALLLWFPAIPALLNYIDAGRATGGAGEWIGGLLLGVISPLNLAFRAAGLDGGLLHERAMDIAAMLATATLAYLPCLAVGLLAVGAVHIIKGQVRGTNAQ